MTHYKHFKHLHVPDHWQQYWSKYPNGYSLLESLINWVGQVNDMVDQVNENNDHVTTLDRNFRALEKELRASWKGYKEHTEKTYTDFREEIMTIVNNWIATIEPTIQDRVVISLSQWLEDGTLADIINQDVFDMKANQSDLDETNQKLAQIAVQVRSNGVDDTEQIQDTYNNLKAGQTLLLTDSYYITNLVFDKPDITIEILGELIQKKSATGTALTIGGLNVVKNIKGVLSVKREGIEASTDWDVGTVGIKFINVQDSNFNIIKTQGFEKGLLFEGDGQGCVYNNITLTSVMNNKINISANVLNNGWSNENKFFGGRLTWDNRFKEVQGKKHIYLPHFEMNQNIFYSPSLEGSGGLFIDINGFHNSVQHPRFEGDSQYINFGEDSVYNVIFYPYGNTLEGKYTNEGMRNTIYFRDLIDSDSVIKGSNGRFRGNPNRYGTENHGVIDVANTGSASNPVFVGRDTSENITSKVDGFGNAEYNTTKTSDIEVLNDNDERVFRVSKAGVMSGNIQISTDIVNYSFVPFALKTTAGEPDTPPKHNKRGVPVLNLADEKIYVYFDGGWKSIQFS